MFCTHETDQLPLLQLDHIFFYQYLFFTIEAFNTVLTRAKVTQTFGLFNKEYVTNKVFGANQVFIDNNVFI